MNWKLQVPAYSILYVSILSVPWWVAAAAGCNQTCGGRKVPFPFGFSSACQIQLNCTSNATILVADFTVNAITSDTILINIPVSCSRPVEALGYLFTQNYAPTEVNAIFLQNCSGSSFDGCVVPTSSLKENQILLDCDMKNDSISCYSENLGFNQTSFIDYKRLTMNSCQTVVTAASITMDVIVKLDYHVMRLGWWLLGECRCSENARCVPFKTALGNQTGYRCECMEGYAGDGFLDGTRCQKDKQSDFRQCTPSKYLSGKCGGKKRIGILIGGVVTAVAISILIIICCTPTRTKLRKSKSRGRSRSSLQVCDTSGITIPIYPYVEMARATEFFSEDRKLGNGAFGTVYAGKLDNSKWFAIKRIKCGEDDIKQVINEIKLLSSVSHPNLIQLLGCSIQVKEQILVFEFMTNGTLFQHLQKERGCGLPWPIRLSIAAETAQAISYLHSEMNPPIYHRDIKSSNILLDYDYKSKLADFGLSRLGMAELSHISTGPRGTPGYIDPQYHQDFHLSDKSDVYSFGVVLCEIITGMKVVDFNRPQSEVNLAALAVDRICRGSLDEIIDPFILDRNGELSSVKKVAELSYRCLIFHREMRPSMMEVAMELDQIKMHNCSSY